MFGLKYILFKLGFSEVIQVVINIVKVNFDFFVIFQWIGGRGGGYYLYEDFYVFIFIMYGCICCQENFILVVGSGFGGVDDIYFYFIGDWFIKYGYFFMLYDGCMFGSCMMVVKEVYMSKVVK